MALENEVYPSGSEHFRNMHAETARVYARARLCVYVSKQEDRRVAQWEDETLSLRVGHFENEKRNSTTDWSISNSV